MKVTNLSTLKPYELFELVTYLEKFCKEGNKREFAISHLRDFFVEIPLEKEIELTSLIEANDFFGVQLFINENPLLQVNLDGDSKHEDNAGIEAKELALESSYQVMKTRRTNVAKQIVAARELTCLKEMKNYGYKFEKFKLTQNYPDFYITKELELYENSLNSECMKVIGLALEYFRKNPKKLIFLQYVFYYLDIIRFNTESKTKLKDEYLKRIHEICSSFK